MMSLITPCNINAYNNHKLLGSWKINKQDTSIDIGRNKIKIITRQDVLGSLITVKKQLYGCYNTEPLIKNPNNDIILTSVRLKFLNKSETLDSIFGIEIGDTELDVKPMIGKINFKLTFISDDVILAESENKIKGCIENGKKDYILIRDKEISSSANPIPLNIFVIGQVLGFSSSHFLDFIWSLIYHNVK